MTGFNYDPPVHPLAENYPLIEGDEFEAMVADVKANGLKVPIVMTSDGTLIDGRNRLRVCAYLGVIPDVRIFDGDDEAIDKEIHSLNFIKRHLTTSQQAMVGAGRVAFFAAKAKERMMAGKAAAIIDIGGQKYTSNDGITMTPVNPGLKSNQGKGRSTELAAKEVGVGRSSIVDAKTVLESGDEDLKKAVIQGKVKVSKAAKQVKARQQQANGAAKDVGSKDAVEHEAPKPLGKDATGTAIPEALNGIFNASMSEDFNAINRILDQATDLILQLAAKPYGVAVANQLCELPEERNDKIKPHVIAIKSLKSALRQICKPYARCPECTRRSGIGDDFKVNPTCVFCKHRGEKSTGYITYAQFEQLTKETKSVITAGSR